MPGDTVACSWGAVFWPTGAVVSGVGEDAGQDEGRPSGCDQQLRVEVHGAAAVEFRQGAGEAESRHVQRGWAPRVSTLVGGNTLVDRCAGGTAAGDRMLVEAAPPAPAEEL